MCTYIENVYISDVNLGIKKSQAAETDATS